jgi:hypothetical protein
MEMSQRKFWSLIIDDFQPLVTVRRENAAEYNEVDAFYVDRARGERTNSALELLKEGLLSSIDRPSPYRALLTGHRGSGKSFELIKLREELAEDFFVVLFDAELTLTPETTNHFDIILGMGIAIFAQAQLSRLNPDPKLADGLLKSLSKFIRKYEDRKGFKLNLTDILKQVAAGLFKAGGLATGDPAVMLAAAAFEATRLELNVGDEHIRTLELPPNRIEIIGALNRIIEWVRSASGKRVLLIVDGLDKVATPRARLLFADSSLLRDPLCSLVYAAPIVFYHRAEAWQAKQIFDAYEMLANVPVQNTLPRDKQWLESRELSAPGIEVMRKVVERRLEKHNLSVDDVITTEAMTLLAQMSGGVMRTLILLFNNAATFAKMKGQDRIDRELALKAVMKQRMEFKLRLNLQYREALEKVIKERTLLGGASGSVEDELLINDYLLSYRDENDAWFDIHPNVLPLLRG